jgi:hypothetical protein
MGVISSRPHRPQQDLATSEPGMTTDKHYFIEENEAGKFAVRAKGSQRASGLRNIQKQAEALVKKLLRDSSGSAHLLAGALRARNIISTNVKLRSPSRRRTTIADNRPATASMSASP